MYGAGFFGVAKRMLPLPPRPPRATTTSCPWRVRSAMISPVSSSMTTVPGGTRTTSGSALAPFMPFGFPFSPRAALKCF